MRIDAKIILRHESIVESDADGVNLTSSTIRVMFTVLITALPSCVVLRYTVILHGKTTSLTVWMACGPSNNTAITADDMWQPLESLRGFRRANLIFCGYKDDCAVWNTIALTFTETGVSMKPEYAVNSFELAYTRVAVHGFPQTQNHVSGIL